MPSPLLSILIPAKDEAGNLPALLDEIHAAFDTMIGVGERTDADHGVSVDYEIIVVDDASTDETWSILMQRAASDARLRPLRHARSAGQSTSVWQAAQAASGEWLATLDGDGQNDPADLPTLLALARRDDLALVAGHRTRRRDDWLKRVSSRLANRIRAALLDDATPDTGCGLKVVRRSAFLALPYFDHMHRFLPALIRAQGGVCRSVAVNHRPRETGQSHYGLNDRLWAGVIDLLGVMWLRKRSRLPQPLEIADTGRGIIETPDRLDESRGGERQIARRLETTP